MWNKIIKKENTDYDSIVVLPGTKYHNKEQWHLEVVVFDSSQIYPEFVIQYNTTLSQNRD